MVLGLGFFLKLSFDNNWIGDTGRILLGIAAGMALLGTGEYAQRRVPLWAQAVTAGGAAILYLSIYSAFALYQLIRPEAALLFLAVVVGLAGLLAIRYESIVIGFLGIIGAFIAPVLLGPELLDIRLALPYILSCRPWNSLGRNLQELALVGPNGMDRLLWPLCRRLGSVSWLRTDPDAGGSHRNVSNLRRSNHAVPHSVETRPGAA